MNTDGFDQMMMTFKPMFKTFYNAMDHRQSMADFKLDDNGMFKRYFSFCDEGKTGELTPVSFRYFGIRSRVGIV